MESQPQIWLRTGLSAPRRQFGLAPRLSLAPAAMIEMPLRGEYEEYIYICIYTSRLDYAARSRLQVGSRLLEVLEIHFSDCCERVY